MEIIERKSLPVSCIDCQEDCAACDKAQERFYISELDRLRTEKKAAEKAAERYRRKAESLQAKIDALEVQKNEIDG